MNSFGNKLQKLREKHNLKITELSNATGISRKTIYDWESNKRHPISNETIELLSSYFGVSKIYFLDDNNSESEDEALKKNPLIKNMLKRIEILEKHL